MPIGWQWSAEGCLHRHSVLTVVGTAQEVLATVIAIEVCFSACLYWYLLVDPRWARVACG